MDWSPVLDGIRGLVTRVDALERRMDAADPCWAGYEMAGTKNKDGKTVPNCVPSK